MGDPLSIAAGVAGLVALGLQSTEYLYKFYAAYRDRDQDLADTVKRLDDLLSTLRIVHDVISVRRWRADEGPILRSIETCLLRCEDVVIDFKNETQKFRKEPGDNLARSLVVLGRRTAYPFRRSTLTKLDEDIHDFHDNLSQALDVLQLKEHQSTQQDMEALKEMLRYAQARHLGLEVRDWLRAPDSSVDYNAAVTKRHAGTGQWFIQSQALKTWLQQENSFLWLYGFAGCGKSVLCSTVIQHVFSQRQSQIGSAVAFFFFTFNDSSKQDASALQRAVLVQLAGQIPGIETELKNLKAACNDGMPPLSKLIEHVRRAVARSRHIYILIDAVDECPEGALRDGLLDTIELMRGWSLPGLHLLITSRNMVDIRDALHPVTQDTVLLKNDEIQHDIRQYVSHCVEHDPKLRRWQDDRQTIKDYLGEHANGVFRWVECQLDPLRRCPRSKYDLDRCLKQLPTTLDATYERMLSAIDEYSQDRARRILVLLCLAARELSVAEVIEAIAVDVDEQERYDPARKLGGPDDLLRICPGLIDIIRNPSKLQLDLVGNDEIVNETRQLNDPVTTQIVRIAHFSVQEYLLSGRIKKGQASYFAVSESVGHAQISMTCLIYLCDENFLNHALTRQLIEQYAFADFAAEYWPYHFRQNSEESTGRLQAWGMALCTTKINFERWAQLYSTKHPLHGNPSYNGRRFPVTAIYCLLLDLRSLLANLLVGRGEDINAKGGYDGSALQAAACRGYTMTVRMLLDAGAEVNARGGKYGDALRAASHRGHLEVIQMLLDAGAEVNGQGGEYGNALQAASYRGHLEVIQMLLDAGADVNGQGGEYGNALQAASYRGHLEVIQMLLDAGADVNGQGGEYGNALQAASYRGHLEVIQMLLDAGADVNGQGGRYGNTLQAASNGGHEKAVRMLLDAGAEATAPALLSASAKEAASGDWSPEVAQMLLDAGG